MNTNDKSKITGTWNDDPMHFLRPKGMGRRSFLQVGMVAGLGLTLGDFFRMKARGEAKFFESKEGPAKSIIHIFLPGGMAHQESWDPKPFAPVEYRGPLGSIPTKVDGMLFSQNLAKTAQIADKITVCRSMTHGEAAHERGTHNMFTGYRPSPALSYPSFGSVISHEFGPRKNLPPYVCVPSMPNEFAGSGYLSSAYGPFSLGSDPADANFQVKDLVLPGGVSPERFAKAKTMLQSVDSHFRTLEKSDALDAMDTFYQRAYGLLSSAEARDAFNMKAEPDALKDAYGRNAAGMRMLLARRLVESGVRMVSLTFGGWDHHDNIAGAINGQMPPFDQAFAMLITDLAQRGLLDSTLVVVSSEFGRTPKINATAGRDHWPKVFSVVLAGGGIKKGYVYGSSDATASEPGRTPKINATAGRDHWPKVFSVVLAGGGIKQGYVYGSSDATASEPDEKPLTVEDFATTIYHQLGIVGDKELMAPGDRPIEIVDGGKVLKDLIA